MSCCGNTLFIGRPGFFRAGDKRIQDTGHIVRALPERLRLSGLFITGCGTRMVHRGDDIPLLCHRLCQPVQIAPVAAKTMRE